jgi:hypothetical protein
LPTLQFQTIISCFLFLSSNDLSVNGRSSFRECGALSRITNRHIWDAKGESTCPPLRAVCVMLMFCHWFVVALFGDEKIRIQINDNGQISYKTIFIKGTKRRIEYSNRERVARILNCDTRKAFTMNPDLGIYSENRNWPWWPSSEELKKGTPNKHKTLNTAAAPEQRLTRTDTGERRDFYGHTARRIVTARELGGDGPSSPVPAGYRAQITYDLTDGWYIDLAVATFCEPDVVFSGAAFEEEDGRILLNASAFPVHELRTTRWTITGADGNTREFVDRFERAVLELSDAPLDSKLFEIPRGFRTVRKIELPER